MLAITSCQDTINTWLALDPWPHVDCQRWASIIRDRAIGAVSPIATAAGRPYRAQPFQFQSQPSNQSARGRPSLSRPLHIRSTASQPAVACSHASATLPRFLTPCCEPCRDPWPLESHRPIARATHLFFPGHELKSSSHPLATGCRFDAATRPPPMSGHASSLLAGDDRLVSPAPGANQDYLEHQRRNGSEGGHLPCLAFSRHPDLPLPLSRPVGKANGSGSCFHIVRPAPRCISLTATRDGAQLTERMTFPRSQCNRTHHDPPCRQRRHVSSDSRLTVRVEAAALGNRIDTTLRLASCPASRTAALFNDRTGCGEHARAVEPCTTTTCHCNYPFAIPRSPKLTRWQPYHAAVSLRMIATKAPVASRK